MGHSGHASRAALFPLFIGSMVIVIACTHQALPFDPDLMAAAEGTHHYKLEGKALILTNANDDQRIESFAPEGGITALGSGSRLDIAFGPLAGGAASLAFGVVFTDGADWRSAAATVPDSGYAVIVRPSVSSFSYHLERTWSGEVNVDMSLVASVSILNNDGTILWSHAYDSGWFRGDVFDPEHDSLAYAVSKALHRKLYDLMGRAAFEFASDQARKVAPFINIEE